MRMLSPPSWLRPAPLAAAILAALPTGIAEAAGSSPWIEGAQSEVRLMGAGALPGGDLLAGVEIRLKPRFITYWRDPGDAGVPPAFSFAGSANLKSASVRYPAPSRLDEAGAEAFGYEGGVTFPILVAPEDPSKPVDLAVRLDYAACHDICLPAHADLRLTLDASPTPEAAPLRDALAAVPRPSTVGAVGPGPEIVAVSPPDAAGGFTVEAALPDAGHDGTPGAGSPAGTLFVEAPEGWAYTAGTAMADGPGRAVFPVKRLDAPGDAGKGGARPAGPLVLTLASPAGAVEVPVTLDAAGAKP